MTILTAALLVIFQADSGVPVVSQGPGAVMELLHNIGSLATAVLVLLLLASLYSWTVILGKVSSFGRATRETRRFIRAFRKATRLQEIATMASDCKASPLAQVFEDVYETYKRQTGGSGPPRNLTPLERSAQTAASEAVTNLERRMTGLATIASTTVYVGLFGTVAGIIDAFTGLGTAGSATLRAVAPGISEALVTTAAGLFVAIPALIAYNQLTARIRVFAAATDDFCRELLNSLEEIPQRGPAQAPRPGGNEPGRDAVGREAVERGLY
ncbi:MAG TPA: MotA/TolQ/ExbB proton channel family protein [Terracidiphilus sp.]|jgi:biopolymer transport protein TolQ